MVFKEQKNASCKMIWHKQSRKSSTFHKCIWYKCGTKCVIQQGLEIRGFGSRKNCAAQNCVFWGYTYVLKGCFLFCFFKKQFNSKTFVQNTRIVRLVLCSTVYLKVIHLFTMEVRLILSLWGSWKGLLMMSSTQRRFVIRPFK